MKLVQLNMESHRHLEERTLPFLLSEKPDVVCLQEVFLLDLPRLKEVLGMECVFGPMASIESVSIHQHHALGEWGVALFYRPEQLIKSGNIYYEAGDEVGGPVVDEAQPLPIFFKDNNPNAMHRVVVWVELLVGESSSVTIGTTHFTWSPKGSFSERQQKSSQRLLTIADELNIDILTGDFNSPRWSPGEQPFQSELGYEQNMFGLLAAAFTDTIPPDVVTSIDGQFHKAGYLQLMVDGVFTRDNISVQNVRVVDGVSDHMAVVATCTVVKE